MKNKLECLKKAFGDYEIKYQHENCAWYMHISKCSKLSLGREGCPDPGRMLRLKNSSV